MTQPPTQPAPPQQPQAPPPRPSAPTPTVHNSIPPAPADGEAEPRAEPPDQVARPPAVAQAPLPVDEPDNGEPSAPSTQPTDAPAAPAAPPRAPADAPTVTWQARDIDDAQLAIPAEQPTLLLFVKGEQARSDSAIAAARQLLGDEPGVQVAAIFSGPTAQEEAQALREAETWPWPIIVDPRYEASGRFRVHAWPTTVLLDPHGGEHAHLAGLPQSHQRDLEAHLAHARGHIDRAALEQRLETNGPAIEHGPEAAARHLRLIERLLAGDQLDMAGRELSRALEQAPDDVQLKLLQVRLHLRRGQGQEALDLLEAIPAAAVPGPVRHTLRGSALLQLGQLEQARQSLTEGLKLNPRPAETHYLLGLVHQGQGQWQPAAEHYRKAFEATPTARTIGPAP